jgi:hypothetical protein
MSSPRAGPLRARLRINEFAAEAIAKLLRVVALSETEDEDVGVVLTE